MAEGLSVPKSESSKVFYALDFARLQNTKPEIGLLIAGGGGWVREKKLKLPSGCFSDDRCLFIKIMGTRLTSADSFLVDDIRKRDLYNRTYD
jgi:hypothetical protein